MRRALFGFRKADVQQALAEAESDAGRQAEAARAHYARAEQMGVALEQTRQACVERDRRMAYLEAELDLSRSNAASQLRALAALGAELEELRVTARGQATRIRLDALREAAEVSSRIRALAGAPEAAAGSMLGALERAIDRLGNPDAIMEATAGERQQGPGLASEQADAGSELAALEAALEPEAAPEVASEPEIGVTAPGATERSPDPAATATSQRVSVDVGPFSDFSQLVTFEDAANAIGATSDISIRRFSEGRASIEVSLSEPVDLLRELESRCDLRFEVRSQAGDELILDLDE